jgi:spore maturation protein CgeE
MSILDKIIECEIEYVKCFCNADEQQDFIRFHDNLIPDMWYHNYTWIKNAKDDTALLQLIESEILHSKTAGNNFCLLRCHIPVNRSILTQLTHEPEVSMAGYYVYDDASKLSKLNKTVGSRVVRVCKIEMLEDILTLDLEHDEESIGRDFCTRRVYRRKDVYLSGEGVDSYICYHNNKPVGSCDLFVHGNIAKIEDFAVSPSHQRKGFGTIILKSLIEIALEKGATIIYLEADEEDTAKDMFQKCGFYKAYEFTDLTFEL